MIAPLTEPAPQDSGFGVQWYFSANTSKFDTNTTLR